MTDPTNTGTNTGEVITRMAAIINATLEKFPPRLAVALWYQTGQSQPDVLLCHESLENCMNGLLKETGPAAVTTRIERLARTRDQAVTENRPDWLQLEILRAQLGPIFDPGNWSNPADPVFLDVVDEPAIHAWATAAFGAIEARRALPEAEQTAAFYAADQHIRSTLWAALDEARRTVKGQWPPVSFVISCDEAMDGVLTRIVERAIPLAEQR